MASSINADNGVVSGSAGLKSTADSSGVLALQTNGTTALSINTAQNTVLAEGKSLLMGTGGEQQIYSGGVSESTYLTFSQWTGAAYTERARITPTGAWSFGSSGTATGTAGQVLTSAGSGAAPTWSTPAAGTAIGLVRAVAINCILP